MESIWPLTNQIKVEAPPTQAGPTDVGGMALTARVCQNCDVGFYGASYSRGACRFGYAAIALTNTNFRVCCGCTRAVGSRLKRSDTGGITNLLSGTHLEMTDAHPQDFQIAPTHQVCNNPAVCHQALITVVCCAAKLICAEWLPLYTRRQRYFPVFTPGNHCRTVLDQRHRWA